MSDALHNQEAGRFEVRVTSDSHFSWMRTRLSVERTLMSWLRTGTALIGFGFTIVQFFHRLGSTEGVAAATLPDAPIYLGLGLIGCGVLALLVATWQYHSVLRYLRSEPFAPIAPSRRSQMGEPAFVVAYVLIFIGVFAFCAVASRAV